VLEKISEEDRKKYGFDRKPHLKRMWKNWVIDRNRGLFLIKNTGMGDIGVWEYELYYGNAVVSFTSKERSSDNMGNAVFDIRKLVIPESLENQIGLVKSDIENALKSLGYFADFLVKETVVVTFLDSLKLIIKRGE